MEKTYSKSELQAGLRVIMAVAETVREAGEAPQGPIYAALMSTGITLAGFQSIVRHLVGAGLVKETTCHTLVWVGPEVAK